MDIITVVCFETLKFNPLYHIIAMMKRPSGKESTEVQITQKIRKERGNSYWKMKKSWTKGTHNLDQSVIVEA